MPSDTNVTKKKITFKKNLNCQKHRKQLIYVYTYFVATQKPIVFFPFYHYQIFLHLKTLVTSFCIHLCVLL